MDQEISELHLKDANDNPAGGKTSGLGMEIRWQEGPLAVDGERREPNGAFVEGVIKAAIGRLNFYQKSRFACAENQMAIGHLESALECLKQRIRAREARGVEGTHAV